MNGLGKFPPVRLPLIPVNPRSRNFIPPHSDRCETSLQLGLFFDGTDNNRDRDRKSFSDSNIARLADSYVVAKGCSTAIYVPGVGTPFPVIGEAGESWRGKAYGRGCEARVLFALLKVLEELNRSIFSSQTLFNDEQIRMLCTKSDLKPFEKRRVQNLGASFGLLQDDYGPGLRKSFLKARADALKAKMKETPLPSLKHCTLDVFGFSRGAASARVFCNWLNEIVEDERLAGVPVQIRFLGLFDTVASAGLMDMGIGTLFNHTAGHGGWANAMSLRVPPLVRNCVHFVAMHELRKNFPLDEINIAGSLPPGSLEVTYPGSHSDVGGGYGPGELGIAKLESPVAGDANKLAQVPLNHMFDYALSCGVPLNKGLARAKRNGSDPFMISDQLRNDFEIFLRETGTQSKEMFEWAKCYLSWRWQVRDRYRSLSQVRNATEQDRNLLERANEKLIEDAELLKSCGDLTSAAYFRQNTMKGKREPRLQRNLILCGGVDGLEQEAPLVLQDAKRAACPPALADFFDKYVHDSYAGFGTVALESTGYWRYRRSFQGNEFETFAINGREQIQHTSSS